MEFFINHPYLSIGWVVVFIAIIITIIQDKMSGIEVVGNNMIAILLNSKKGVIVDTRPLADFRSGHIKKSVHLLPTDVTSQNTGKIDSYKDKPIILVNQDGLNLLDLGKKLKKQGYNSVFILKDGINGWSTDNLPLVK